MVFRCGPTSQWCVTQLIALKLLYPRSLIKSTRMTKVSTARKLGVITRVAGKQIGKSRAYGAVRQAYRATAGHCSRVLSQLWLEVTGFVFLALAAIGGLAFAREYAKYHSGHVGLDRVVLAICFTALFGWFGLSSFWRVRKKG